MFQIKKDLMNRDEAKQLLRQLKLRDLENEIKPDMNRLSDDVMDVVRKMSDKGYVIGGSVTLILYGLGVRQRIGDVDLFFSEDHIEKPFDNYEIVNSSEYPEAEGEEKFKRFKVATTDNKLYNFQFDIFEKKTPYTVIDGIKFGSPFVALKAKISYWRTKDISDFDFIGKKFFGYHEFRSRENEEFLLNSPIQ